MHSVLSAQKQTYKDVIGSFETIADNLVEYAMNIQWTIKPGSEKKLHQCAVVNTNNKTKNKNDVSLTKTYF